MMEKSDLHNVISLKQIALLLGGLSLFLQIILISYNHVTGFYSLDGASDFLIRLGWGGLLTFAASWVMAYPDLYMIDFLNRSASWEKSILVRAVTELTLTLLGGLLIGLAVTGISHLVSGYEEDLFMVFLFNGIVGAICNLLIVITFEAWIFFRERSASESRNRELMAELTEIRFEVLKNQMNPHFMFNSLNVLSSLIETDPEKSQRFIEEFSSIYRYILETIEQHVVSVKRELEFARSYMYLQQIRYGDALSYEVDLSSDALQCYVPPLSLQVVLENAIKHNIISEDQPLEIRIFEENGSLKITNHLQPKFTFGTSTGIGQQNLKKRFAMTTGREPEFRLLDDCYIATLPLIKEERHEGTDH
jgi:sensor histidine kinase YesM